MEIHTDLPPFRKRENPYRDITFSTTTMGWHVYSHAMLRYSSSLPTLEAAIQARDRLEAAAKAEHETLTQTSTTREAATA